MALTQSPFRDGHWKRFSSMGRSNFTHLLVFLVTRICDLESATSTLSHLELHSGMHRKQFYEGMGRKLNLPTESVNCIYWKSDFAIQIIFLQSISKNKKGGLNFKHFLNVAKLPIRFGQFKSFTTFTDSGRHSERGSPPPIVMSLPPFYNDGLVSQCIWHDFQCFWPTLLDNFQLKWEGQVHHFCLGNRQTIWSSNF